MRTPDPGTPADRLADVLADVRLRLARENAPPRRSTAA